MMFYWVSCLARKEFARSANFYRNNFLRNNFFQNKFFQNIFFQRSGVSFVLGGILLLNGCGGSPAASSSSTTPTGSSTGSLSVSSTLPAGTVGASYNATLAVTGGTAPYSFSTASGQLPAGVVLGGSTGTISGTPTASGSFSFEVSVTDSKGDSKEQGLQMTVASAAAANPPSPSPPSPNPPTTNPTSQSTGNTFSHVQGSGGWSQFGQGPPKFVDCSPSPCGCRRHR
jgi:hypothetical protein